MSNKGGESNFNVAVQLHIPHANQIDRSSYESGWSIEDRNNVIGRDKLKFECCTKTLMFENIPLILKKTEDRCGVSS